MSDVKCPCCARRDPAPGLVVCRICLDRLDDDLARIAELTRLAASWQPRTNGEQSGRSVPGSRPPLSVDILDAALGHDALALVESWERMTREYFGLSPYGPASLRRDAARTARNVPWSAETAEVVSLAGCVDFMRSQLARIVEAFDYPIEDLSREIRDCRISLERTDPDHDTGEGMRIPCPASHPDADGRDCGYRLVVVPTRPGDDVECRRCGTVWTSGRLILVALNDANVTIWAYPADIENALGIPKRTVQRWGADGIIRRRGTQYDVGAAFRTRLRVG